MHGNRKEDWERGNITIKELLSDSCGFECEHSNNGQCGLKDDELIKGGDCKKLIKIARLVDKGVLL
jgi:hypothetical protein